MKSGKTGLIAAFIISVLFLAAFCGYFIGIEGVLYALGGLTLFVIVVLLVDSGNAKTNAKDYGEKQMRQMLEQYVPEGESLIAGVHGYGMKTIIHQVIYGAYTVDGMTFPAKDGAAYLVTKEKHAGYEVYLAMTERHYIFSACERGLKYYSGMEEIELPQGVTPQQRQSLVNIQDIGIGYIFSQEDIESCVTNADSGGKYTDCAIKLKGGVYFEIRFLKKNVAPESAPHYLEYRDMILKCLRTV